jgi:hypothetical protein
MRYRILHEKTLRENHDRRPAILSIQNTGNIMNPCGKKPRLSTGNLEFTEYREYSESLQQKNHERLSAIEHREYNKLSPLAVRLIIEWTHCSQI